MIVDPRLAEPPPTPPRYPEYVEYGCARGWRVFLGAGLVPIPACAGIVAAAFAGSADWAIALAGVLLGSARIGIKSLMSRLPLGIRLDEHGVHIGGIKRALHVSECEWAGVRRITVLTSRKDLRLLRRSYVSKPCELPWWSLLGSAPWAPGRFIDTRLPGLLVVEVETERASFTATAPPKGKYGSADAVRIYSAPAMTWVIPTRHPDRLRAALNAAQPPLPRE